MSRQIPVHRTVFITMSVPKIGDFLLLTPLLQQIARERGERVRIDVPPPLRSLYRALGLLPLNRAFSPRAADHIIDLTYPGIPGPPAHHARLAAEPFGKPQHVSLSYAEALNAHFAEISPETKGRPFIDLEVEISELRARGLEPFRYFTIHSGSDFAPKNWPAANYRRVLELIHQTYPQFKCVELIGPSDEPLYSPGLRPAWISTAAGSLFTAAKLLAGAAFHVDNDSGVHHLAGAMDVPTISVWGPTAPGTWGSVTTRNFLHWGGPSCPDHCRGLKAAACADRVCLTNVVPQQLLASARTILEAYGN